MSARALLAAAALALAAGAAAAQGFAGMGSAAEGFAPVTPGRAFSFPRDHGAHPRFRIEWWYVVANLTAEDGRELGVQWTLFRQALAPEGRERGWASPQVWMAHAAVTSARKHLTARRFGRGGVGQAGVAAAPFRAWIDEWALASAGEDFSPLRLRARGEGFSYDLTLTAAGPVALQGEGGFSLKSERGQASYYYSNPFFEVSGTVTLAGEAVSVTGRAWLDREWSSQPLDPDQTGWDWFALHLPGGAKLMLYRMRETGGEARMAGTWIAPDGTPETLPHEAIEMAPVASAEVKGREIPVSWDVAIPSRALKVRIAALNAQAWMDGPVPYWEGPVRFSGTHAGVGYMEMTGR